MSQPVDAIPAEQSEQPQPATPNNLPLQPTPLIGRKQEAERICRSLLSPDVRLFTLTGPPGVGKTRLSLHLASSLLSNFSDGVFFVNLAPISDHSLVASEIARALDVREAGGQSSLENFKAFLRDKSMLLVLDNFEQVIEAAQVVAELAQASPGVKLLVTSRMRLQLRGEHVFEVLPLAMPPLDHLPPIEELVKYEAIRLFVERATAIKSDFVVTDRSASSVSEICHRLDGLPLAIELAAARVKILPAQAMLLRLQRGLQLLTGGAHDLPARQRTLRSAIAWSYDLLNSRDQLLFRRLAVFVGGRSLEAIEAVCNADGAVGPDVLEGLSSLVDKSLLRQEEDTGGEPRFVMLETLHEYAREKLEESGEVEDSRRHHALYFTGLAEKGELKVWGPTEIHWLDRLDQEHDNVRAALQWSHSVEGDIDLELRLVVAMGRFWEIRGHLSEGRERIAAVLSKPESREGKMRLLRAWAVMQATDLAFWQTDYLTSRPALEEALTIFRELGDKQGVARALITLSDITRSEGDHDKALLLVIESLAVCRELGDVQGIVISLVLSGWAEMHRGYYTQASAYLEEALSQARQIQIPNRTALALTALGEFMVRQGKYEQATGYLEESLAIRRSTGYRSGIAATLGTIALAALRQKDYRRAAELLVESLTMRKELGDKGGVAWCLEKFAQIESVSGDAARGARLLGAAGALREVMGTAVDWVDQAEYDDAIAALRTRLGPAFSRAWEEGQAMTFAEAVAYAQSAPPVEEEPAGSSHLDAVNLHPGGLTQREREIAALIAQSKSNSEIAEALVISKRTVETHITNILSKLGFTSRGQVAAWAIKKDIASRSD